MTRLEKVLAVGIAGIVGIFGIGFGVRTFLLKPLKEADKRIAGLREKLEKVKSERRVYFADEERMKSVAQQMFSERVDLASAKSGEILTKVILQSGLKESDFTRLPVGPRKLLGASEIGWSVQGDGSVSEVINLIFLLKESLFLNRVENLFVSAGDAPGFVRVRFRYLTLVLEPAPTVEPIDLSQKLTLESAQRRAYDGIISRDILRPYVKRLSQSAAGSDGSAASAAKGPPGPESFRIVSLSEWQGEPEIHVRDLTSQKTFRYKPGDPLAGGTVVMVDYRPAPTPGRETVQSESRVILRFGLDYWAIERGQTLSDKRLLKPEQLPRELLGSLAP